MSVGASKATKEGIEVVRRYFEEAVRQGNLVLIDKLFAPDYVDQSARQSGAGQGAAKEFVRALWASMPDLRCTIDEIKTVGDHVVVGVTFEGTMVGPLGYSPPTGELMRWGGTHIFRVVGGKIVEHWGDNVLTLKVLGRSGNFYGSRG